MTRVWAILVVATLLSWGIAESAVSARLAAIAIILIAAFKIRMVIGGFMGLRWRPRPWRIVLELWVLATMTIVFGGYMISQA